MTHLDEGTIVALRDGMPVLTTVTEHLDGCGACRGALAEAEGREARIAESLAALDGPTDTEAAKEAVRRRLDRERARAHRPRIFPPLGRAAAVLLVTAGVAAAAAPGSPVRDWIFGPGATGPAQGVTETGGQEAHQGAIEVNVPDGRIEVVLADVMAGTTVEVVWTDRAVARVAAAAGTSFSFGEGRAEASVVGGPVRIELPRFAPDVSLTIDGTRYLTRTSGTLQVLEPVDARSEDRIRFVVQDR